MFFQANSSRKGFERNTFERGLVRRSTPERINQRIDEQTDRNIEYYRGASQNDRTRRIRELELEWDIERMLQLSASTLALAGLVLGMTKNRRWLALPGIALPFLLQHSIQGWCPPLSIFRALGVRTRQEIDREKYSLMNIGANA